MKRYWKMFGLNPNSKNLADANIKVKSEVHVTWKTWFRRALIFFGFACASTAIVLFNTEADLSKGNFRLGEPAQRALFAPIDVEFVNPLKTEKLKVERMQQVPWVYKLDTVNDQAVYAQINELFQSLAAAQNDPAKDARVILEEVPFEFSASTIKFLSSTKDLTETQELLHSLFEKTASQGILSYRARMELLRGGQESITVIDPMTKAEKLMPVENLFVLNEIHENVQTFLPENLTKKRNQRAALLDMYRTISRANLIYDGIESQRRKNAVAESIEPVKQFIKKDQLIIQRGMLVTADVKLAVDHIHEKMIKREQIKKMVAVGLLSAFAYGLFFCFLFYFERKKMLSLRHILLLHTVILTAVFICKVVGEWPGSSPYFMPTALASLLIVLLLDARLGSVTAFLTTVLVAPIADFQPAILLGALLSGVTASFAAKTVRKRIQFIQVGFVIGCVYTSVFFVLQLFQESSALDALQVSAAGGFLNGLLITMPILFLLLPVFEYMFDVTTDITLLELSDLNHPLLKRMILEAPGTYHHSLVVSRLSEMACEEIGANALLARVGCYFHDIGKIARSEYFGENQSGRFGQKHEKITATMSSLIIISHVKDGIELGRKHKLKESVLKFIPEHQGTGVVYYFYRKALDAAEPGEEVNMDDFRYPGPNPQSKETAVAMIADSVEAASRSMKEPTPEELRQMVRKIINDKFIDGQLNDCDLTLNDLHKIQESFVQNLMGIYHTRVSYPEKPKDHKSPDLFENSKETVQKAGRH